MAWRATGSGLKFASRQYTSGAAVAGQAAGKGAGGGAPVGGRGGGGIVGGGNAANVGGQSVELPRARGDAQRSSGKGKGGSRGPAKQQLVTQLIEALKVIDAMPPRKQGPVQVEPEWVCGCGVPNYVTRPACRMCSAPWEDSPEAKQALEWTKGGFQHSKRALKRQNQREKKKQAEEQAKLAEVPNKSAGTQQQVQGAVSLGTTKGAPPAATAMPQPGANPAKGTPAVPVGTGSLSTMVSKEGAQGAGSVELQHAKDALGRTLRGLSTALPDERRVLQEAEQLVKDLQDKMVKLQAELDSAQHKREQALAAYNACKAPHVQFLEHLCQMLQIPAELTVQLAAAAVPLKVKGKGAEVSSEDVVMTEVAASQETSRDEDLPEAKKLKKTGKGTFDGPTANLEGVFASKGPTPFDSVKLSAGPTQVIVASSPFAETPSPLSCPSPFVAGAQGLGDAAADGKGSFDGLRAAFESRNRQDRSRSPVGVNGACPGTPVPTEDQLEAARVQRQQAAEEEAPTPASTEAGC